VIQTKKIFFKDYLYVLPALVMVVGFLMVPVVSVIITSFSKWDLLHPMEFVGLKNYFNIFTDVNLLISTRNTLIWVGMILLFPMVLGLLFAVFLRNIWFSNQIKSIFYLPLAMSGTGIGIIWRWIFTHSGLLNSALAALGIISEPRSWLIMVPQNTFAMIAASTWQVTGLNMVLFLMGLQDIPAEIIEAAKIDGASGWKSFTNIILPILRPTTTIVVILNIIGSFKIFDIIWPMTAGGPARASETLAVSMYKESFGLFHFGYGSAIAVILSLIIFVIGLAYLRIVALEK